MTKLDAIISRTPLVVNGSNDYMQIKVQDFQWLLEQARTLEAVSFRIGAEEEELQKARDLKQERTALKSKVY